MSGTAFFIFSATNKKAPGEHPEACGAEGGGRTRTPLREHAPETCASASFATSAVQGWTF